MVNTTHNMPFSLNENPLPVYKRQALTKLSPYRLMFAITAKSYLPSASKCQVNLSTPYQHK